MKNFLIIFFCAFSVIVNAQITGGSKIKTTTSSGIVTVTLDSIFQIGLKSATVYVEISGNDASGKVGVAQSPFLTINAALSAIPLGGVVKIGQGTFASPDTAHIRSNVVFQGSGKPTTDANFSQTSFGNGAWTTPTKLVGGTILQGTLYIPYWRDNIQIFDLGVDVGSNFIGAGTGQDAIIFPSKDGTSGNILLNMRKNIVLQNISALNKTSGETHHCIVVEHCIDPKIINVDTWFGFAGLVIKSVGADVVNYTGHGHSLGALYLKSSYYASGYNYNVTNCHFFSVASYDGTAIQFETDSSGNSLQNVNITNCVAYKTQFGVSIGQNRGGFKNINITNLSVISPSATGISGNYQNSTFTNCTVTNGATYGFNVQADTGNLQLIGCKANLNAQTGFFLTSVPMGRVNLNDCIANNNGVGGFYNVNGNVDSVLLQSSGNPAGNYTGTIGQRGAPSLFTSNGNTIYPQNYTNGQFLLGQNSTTRNEYKLNSKGAAVIADFLDIEPVNYSGYTGISFNMRTANNSILNSLYHGTRIQHTNGNLYFYQSANTGASFYSGYAARLDTVGNWLTRGLSVGATYNTIIPATNNAIIEGSVGIGISSPAYKLDVSADSRFNGVLVGRGAGNIASNTAVGYNSGQSNTTGSNNSFLGYNSGYYNTTGNSNSFIGVQAGQSNTTGNNNSFLGYNSGYYNTAGSSNSFLGYQAGYYNTIGNGNSFLGLQAGFSNTTGSNNSFIGVQAGQSNTTGNSNSFIGYQAGQSNTTGSNNSFIGVQAGFSNTTGNSNAFLGYAAGYYNTTGNSNSFIGFAAGYYNTTGNSNSFIGYQAGYYITTGSNNAFLGVQAGFYNTTGNNNAFLGYNAGGINISGSSNTYLGVQSTGVTNESSRSNMLAIGTYAGGTYIFGDSTGAIGVGTKTPAYKLDVNATANPLRLQGLVQGASTDDVLSSSGGVVTKNSLGNLNFTNNIYGAGNSYQSQIGKQYLSYISDTLVGTTYLNRNSVNDYGFVGFYKNGTAQTYNINYYNLLSYDISEKTQYNGIGVTTNVNKASRITGTTFYQYSGSIGFNLYDINNNGGSVSFDSLNLSLKGANNLAYNIKADSLIVKPLTGINFQGVKYAADYSTNYTTRSLVDKAYVDAKFSNTTFTTYNSAIASGAETTIAITVTGLTTSGEVSSSFSGTKPQGLIVMPVEKSANTVTFHLYNATGASITPNITLSATVLKY